MQVGHAHARSYGHGELRHGGRHIRDYGGSFGQIGGAFKVHISWIGTGAVIKTVNADGTVTRRRAGALIDLRATFKGEVLVDVTGITGPFPRVTRDNL